MLSNINFPVTCTLRVELASGGKIAIKVLVGENDSDIIERLWICATDEQPNADPKKPLQAVLSILDGERPKHRNSARKEYKTIGGETFRTEDGVYWEKEPGHHVDPKTGEVFDVPEPTKPAKAAEFDGDIPDRFGYEETEPGRPDEPAKVEQPVKTEASTTPKRRLELCPYERWQCQLIEECGTVSCPGFIDAEHFRTCSEFGLSCADDSLCATRYQCPRKAEGEIAVKAADEARALALRSVKRGRPRKVPGPTESATVDEKPKEKSNVLHSGESCNFRFIACAPGEHACSDGSCVHLGSLNEKMTYCGKEPDIDRCRACRQHCVFNFADPMRRPFCNNTDRCATTCLNFWCVRYTQKSNPRLSDENAQKVVEAVYSARFRG
jgi:hypothetical protein